jgi:hypothetical protein
MNHFITIPLHLEINIPLVDQTSGLKNSAWLVPVAALALFAGGLRVANSLTNGPTLKSEHAQAGQGIPPDMLVVVTTDAKIFHVAGCGFIHNKDTERTLTAKEAMREGYVPCLRCLRE